MSTNNQSNPPPSSRRFDSAPHLQLICNGLRFCSAGVQQIWRASRDLLGILAVLVVIVPMAYADAIREARKKAALGDAYEGPEGGW